MSTKKTHWLDRANNTTTRSRSGKQESRIAKDLKGVKTINSGATFGENDVTTDYCEVEAKTTRHKSYSISLKEWYKASKKCSLGKIPMFVVDFETEKESLAIISYSDLKYLIEKANGKD